MSTSPVSRARVAVISGAPKEGSIRTWGTRSWTRSAEVSDGVLWTKDYKVPETKVLLVDDDARLLQVLVGWLQSRATESERADGPAFDVETTTDAMSALQLMEERGPYAVVVADYHMPEMDGVCFFERVKILSPLTVRIMLSGEGDLTKALEAVNRGPLFRFLMKPCRPSTITSAVVAGLRQHQLLIAERQLLEETLGGTVRLLTEILTLVNPTAASRAQRTRRCVQHLVRKLHLPDGWQIEVAAALSHLGFITLGGAEEAASNADAPPSEEARRALEDHPALAQKLLRHIPRLEGVAAIIARQRDPIDLRDINVPLHARDKIRLGGQVVRVALAFDAGLAEGSSRSEVLRQLALRPTEFDAALVHSLTEIDFGLRSIPRRVAVNDVIPGMILDDDLHGETGVLVMKRGQEMTLPMLARLKGAASKAWLRTKITVIEQVAPDAEQFPNPGTAAPIL